MGGNFKCYTCQKFFSHYRSLQRHIEHQHRRPQRFECHGCDRTYGRADNLQVHQRKHLEKQAEKSPRERDPERKDSPERRARSPRRRSPQRRNPRSRSPQRKTSRQTSSPRMRREAGEPGRRSSTVIGPQERRQAEEVRESPQRVARNGDGDKESENSCDDELVINMSPVTRQCVEGSKTPLTGKARGMWALQEAERRAADSTSEDVTEPEGPGGQGDGDVPTIDIRRVQLGKDIGGLDAHRTLTGTAVNVSEHSTATSYGEQGIKVFQEGREREYRMVVQRSTDQHSQTSGISKLHRVSEGEVGTPFTAKELEEACVGRVKHIKQTVKRETFRDGVLIHQEETVTNFEVDVEAGFLTKHCC